MKNAFNIGYYIISSVLCLLGILLIACPQFFIAFMGIIFGVLLIVFGCVKIGAYFSKGAEFRTVFQSDLSTGLILLALGIVILCNPESVMLFVCITMGVFLLTDGVFKIQSAVEVKKHGVGRWQVILVVAIVTVLLGVLLLFRPGFGETAMMVILGISLLADGLLNFITALISSNAEKHRPPETIDIDPTEYHEK